MQADKIRRQEAEQKLAGMISEEPKTVKL
jgi:hypothetical protein